MCEELVQEMSDYLSSTRELSIQVAAQLASGGPPRQRIQERLSVLALWTTLGEFPLPMQEKPR